MEFYNIRMVNHDEYTTDVEPRTLTGDWAIIQTYQCLFDYRWRKLGYRKGRVVLIRPANIVSYTTFSDEEVSE